MLAEKGATRSSVATLKGRHDRLLDRLKIEPHRPKPGPSTIFAALIGIIIHARELTAEHQFQFVAVNVVIEAGVDSLVAITIGVGDLLFVASLGLQAVFITAAGILITQHQLQRIVIGKYAFQHYPGGLHGEAPNRAAAVDILCAGEVDTQTKAVFLGLVPQ